MPVYERVDAHGQVVERVQTIEGSIHDTELGVAVLDGVGGWRPAGTTPPAPAETPLAAPEPPPVPGPTHPHASGTRPPTRTREGVTHAARHRPRPQAGRHADQRARPEHLDQPAAVRQDVRATLRHGREPGRPDLPRPAHHRHLRHRRPRPGRRPHRPVRGAAHLREGPRDPRVRRRHHRRDRREHEQRGDRQRRGHPVPGRVRRRRPHVRGETGWAVPGRRAGLGRLPGRRGRVGPAPHRQQRRRHVGRVRDRHPRHLGLHRRRRCLSTRSRRTRR